MLMAAEDVTRTVKSKLSGAVWAGCRMLLVAANLRHFVGPKDVSKLANCLDVIKRCL